MGDVCDPSSHLPVNPAVQGGEKRLSWLLPTNQQKPFFKAKCTSRESGASPGCLLSKFIVLNPRKRREESRQSAGGSELRVSEHIKARSGDWASRGVLNIPRQRSLAALGKDIRLSTQLSSGIR